MPTVQEQIEHLKTYDPNMPCAMHLWLPDDVKETLQNMKDDEITELTDEEIAEVLDRLERKCDSNIGLNWEVLEIRIEEVINEREREDTDGKEDKEEKR